MEKEQNQNPIEDKNDGTASPEIAPQNLENEGKIEKEDFIEKTPEEKILELEDKLARTFAEMENQRRRFEKEKEEAFEYGGFAFAKEALNLIDNLERSKEILRNDASLKDSESLKKTLEHFEIINRH